VSGNGWLIAVGIFVAGLIGLFLYGWLRRKDKPPPGVKPLKDDRDDW
jgi:LPXTG-motif cell wall-anchored protein